MFILDPMPPVGSEPRTIGGVEEKPSAQIPRVKQIIESVLLKKVDPYTPSDQPAAKSQRKIENNNETKQPLMKLMNDIIEMLKKIMDHLSGGKNLTEKIPAPIDESPSSSNSKEGEIQNGEAKQKIIEDYLRGGDPTAVDPDGGASYAVYYNPEYLAARKEEASKNALEALEKLKEQNPQDTKHIDELSKAVKDGELGRLREIRRKIITKQPKRWWQMSKDMIDRSFWTKPKPENLGSG